MWQMGGLGPMQGQLNHFNRTCPVVIPRISHPHTYLIAGYAPEKIQYGIDRYRAEVRRLYRTMEETLKKTPYLAGDKFTIADIASWPWVCVGSMYSSISFELKISTKLESHGDKINGF